MDADFSHDPRHLPEFLELSADLDVVIGSRYMRGVTVVNWPMGRLILSWSANWYARIVTGLPLHDRSEEHTSELQSLMRTSYAVFCLKKKTHHHLIIPHL